MIFKPSAAKIAQQWLEETDRELLLAYNQLEHAQCEVLRLELRKARLELSLSDTSKEREYVN